jgi:predicted permease
MLPRFIRRLRDRWHQRRLEREIDEEIRFHVEKEIEHQLALGKTPAEARQEALRQFGGVEQTKEDLRDHHGLGLLGELIKDLRFGLRMLRKTPGFTLVAVLSLALGIGANTALFSVAESLLLATLPVVQPDRLALFEWEAGLSFRNSGTSGWSDEDRDRRRRSSSSFHHRIYQQLSSERSAVADLAAFAGLDVNLVFERRAEVAPGQVVSGNYFRMLGVRAHAGRTLTEADDRPGAPPAAMISHPYWQARLGGDPAVVGKKLSINGVSFTIVGILPPAFTGTMQVGSRVAVMLPLALEPLIDPGRNSPGTGQRDGGRRRDWWLNLLGRLQPGATVQQAQDSLNGLFQSLALEIMPAPSRDDQPARLDVADWPVLVASPGARGMLEDRRGYSTTIRWLFGALGLVLMIACANVANMQLARSGARRTEITVRVALGASRTRLVRQLLTESLLVAMFGGLAGIGMAVLGQRVAVALAREGGGLFPTEMHYGLSGRLLGFTLLLSLSTAVLFGLVPALRATRLDLATALKQGRRAPGGAANSRLSKALVVAQVAMSLVLLLGAGLFLRTVRNLQTVELGFNQQNLLLFGVFPSGLGYDARRLESFYDRLSARLQTIPGLSSVTFANVPLISRGGSTGRIILPGETARSPFEHPADKLIVRENYLETLEIPLLRGRRFTAADHAASPRVAIVNEDFARRYFPGREALGQRIAFGRDDTDRIQIVGIARDTKYNLQRKDIRPLVYTPWRQEPSRIGRMSFSLRTMGSPSALIPAVREIVRQLDANLPVTDLGTQVERSRRTIAAERFTARLLTFFGALAALLAAIGLYGVMAYSVAQRTAEIGIRMALGAQIRAVVKMVAGQGLKFAAVGVVLGALAAQALQRVVASQLYGVTTADPLTILVVVAGLLAVCLLACWVPALRAARVDPMVALRSE